MSMSYHLRRFPWVAEMIPFALAPADPHWTGPDGAQHPAAWFGLLSTKH